MVPENQVCGKYIQGNLGPRILSSATPHFSRNLKKININIIINILSSCLCCKNEIHVSAIVTWPLANGHPFGAIIIRHRLGLSHYSNCLKLKDLTGGSDKYVVLCMVLLCCHGHELIKVFSSQGQCNQSIVLYFYT